MLGAIDRPKQAPILQVAHLYKTCKSQINSEPLSSTSCPVLVNTSFNVRGEPIVCTPEDSFRCFMGTGIDALAIGNCLLRKEDQPSSLKESYAEIFDLD